MRAVIWELSKTYGCTEQRYNGVSQLFHDINENLPRHRFDVTATRLLSIMKRRWRKKMQRPQYLQRFGKKQFLKLTKAEKAQHTLRNCSGCAGLGKWHDAFPLRSNVTRMLARPTRRTSVQQHEVNDVPGQNKAAALRELQQDWLPRYGSCVEDDLIAQPGTNLQKKQNKSEKKKFIRDLRMTVGPGAVQSKKKIRKRKTRCSNTLTGTRKA